MKKIILLMLSILLISGLFIGCDDGAVKEVYSHTTSTDTSVLDTYTVTFDMQGHGTPIDPITDVISGSTISAPTDPTETDYSFKGWYKETSCTNAWNFGTDTVTTDTTLYAKWAETRLVSDILSTVSGGFPTTGTPGFSPISGAWRNPSSFGCWIYSTSGYSAIYFSNGPQYTMLSIGDNKAEKDGDTYKWDPAGTDDTITFNMTGGVLTSIEISGTGGGGYYGTYNKTYTVTFDMQGHGTSIDPITDVISGSTISAPTDPTKTGYTFYGWYKETSCTNVWDFATDTVTTDTTLYAKWEKDKTIADVLATNPDFPTTETNAWMSTDGSGKKCYLTTGWFVYDTQKCSPTLPVVKSGDDYVLDNYSHKCTFKMTSGVLTKIEYTSLWGNATYAPPSV